MTERPFLEDYAPGERFSFGQYEVTRDEVLEFAGRYDPQPFHLSDTAAAANPIFGRLSASGWHTAAMTMRMMVEHWSETKLQSLGSPGVDELRWLRPVFPGDVLTCEAEVLSVKASVSKPDRGALVTRQATLNQNGEPVMTMLGTTFVKRRP